MTEPSAAITEQPAPKSRRGTTIAIVVVFVATLGVAVLLFTFWRTAVPDVVLTKPATASALLSEAGLKLGAISKVATTGVGPGLIAEQSEPAGSMVPRTSSIDVTEAVQPAPARVPKVTGLDRAAAERALTDALFLPLVVDVFDDTSSRETVLGQAPGDGTEWLTGRQVAIAVCVGSR